MPEDLIARIDAACSAGQSRGEFVRGAVEQALGLVPSLAPAEPSAAVELASVSSVPVVDGSEGSSPLPAPAEQPSRALSSFAAKRDVRPIPKKGKT